MIDIVPSLYESPLTEVDVGFPIHRLRVEFPDGIPIQGDHVRSSSAPGGVRDKRQSAIDAGRMEIAIVAATEPTRPRTPYVGVPMFVEVTCWIPRPKTGPNRLDVGPHVAVGGAGRGDGDKVCRFVWDALSGGAVGGARWFDDDCRVSQWAGRRRWMSKEQTPRIEVAVVPLTASDPVL